jgi:hypothetical protein
MTTPLTTAIDRLLESKGPATRWLESNSEIIRKWIEEDKMAEEWIEWGGGKCPVDPATPIEPLYRGPEDESKGERITFAPAGRLAWWHDEADDDIIAYRVVQP